MNNDDELDDIDKLTNLINNKPLTDAMAHINAKIKGLKMDYRSAQTITEKSIIKSELIDFLAAYQALLKIADK